MKKFSISALLVFLLIVMMPCFGLAANEEQTTIKLGTEHVYLQQKKTAGIKLTVSPRAARSAGVTYQSDNEAVATVSERGKITAVAVGNCNIIITSKYDSTVTVALPVSVVIPAKKIYVTSAQPTVRVGETLATAVSFEPDDTSVHEVTYKSSNNRIATVDEAGTVTGVKAGKVSITAFSVDGGKARGKLNLQVVQPVTGVSFKTPRVRVGAKYHGSFSATLEPKNATNHNMTWTSSDTSVATVSGKTNKVRVNGLRWGQSVITGITEDGAFTVSFTVDVGSLRHAVRVQKLELLNGDPRISLKNNSNLRITQVRYVMRAFDIQDQPVQMSERSDWLYGTYDEALEPGEYTRHGLFNFIRPISTMGIARLEFAITGWSTDTGYYNSKGNLLYSFDLSEAKYEWQTCNSDLPMISNQ